MFGLKADMAQIWSRYEVFKKLEAEILENEITVK